ncbi:hypothetical protein VTK56DRAFT_5487 [Thermocarpiscus australiensis]
MFFLKALIAVGGLAGVSQAHMKLRIPAPFTTPEGTSSPLDPSGSNFPCQIQPGVQFQGTPTPMEKGSKQKMGFTGQAVHGGGSCQVSITYDKSPTKQSSWKVIHSIQGGCPARNVAGNAGNDANAPDPDEYEFTIPQDIPSGDATLAWTWVNKIGNREFYMMCAPVTITGGGNGGGNGSTSALTSLPDMFIANIPSLSDCATVEGVDIKYPNPGSSVENNPGANLGAPKCGAGGGAGAGAGSVAAAPTTAPTTAPAVRGRRAPLRV